MQEGTSLHLGKIHFVWEIIVLSYLSRTNILIRVAKIILREFNPNFGSTVSLEWIYCIRRTKSSLGGRENSCGQTRKKGEDWLAASVWRSLTTISLALKCYKLLFKNGQDDASVNKNLLTKMCWDCTNIWERIFSADGLKDLRKLPIYSIDGSPFLTYMGKKLLVNLTSVITFSITEFNSISLAITTCGLSDDLSECPGLLWQNSQTAADDMHPSAVNTFRTLYPPSVMIHLYWLPQLDWGTWGQCNDNLMTQKGLQNPELLGLATTAS